MQDPPVARVLEEPAPIPADTEQEALDVATRYMRAIRYHDREIANIEQRYQKARAPIAEELAVLDAWREDALAGEQRQRERLVLILEQFGRAWKERTGHAPTKLPFGKITVTPPRDSLIVVDNDAFVDWAEGTERIGLVRYKKEPDKDAVKKLVIAGEPTKVPEPEAEREYRQVVLPGSKVGEKPVIVPGLALSKATQESVSVKVPTRSASTGEEDE